MTTTLITLVLIGLFAVIVVSVAVLLLREQVVDDSHKRARDALDRVIDREE